MIRRWAMICTLIAAPLPAWAAGGGLTAQDVQRWMDTQLAVHALQPGGASDQPLSAPARSAIEAAGYGSVAQFRAHGQRVREAAVQLQQDHEDDPALVQQLDQIKDLRAAGLLEQAEYAHARDELESKRIRAQRSQRDWPAVKPRLNDFRALQAYLDGRRDTPPTW